MLETIGLIICVGMFAQWLAWKQKIPMIITLILSGFIMGPVLNVLNPVETIGQNVIFAIVEISVALILFDGAMQLKFSEFKEVSGGLKRILTLGVGIHFILIMLAAKYILKVSWGGSALLGGILIVTGPTVIIPALREACINKRIAKYLKWEGILTDPVGAIIAIVVYDVIVLSTEADAFAVVNSIIKIILVSIAFSFSLKWILEQALKRNLIPEFLQIPFITSLAITSFVFSNEIQHGSGLLTVTILGILIGNSGFDILKNLRSFKEHITTMCISFVFILITASIPLEVFQMIGWSEILFIFFVTFVLRIAAIFISTLYSGMSFREKLIIGSFGPRGIVAASVAAVLSAEMIKEGIRVGDLFLPIVFLVVFSTVVTHGVLLKPLTKKLNLERENKNGVIFIGTMPWVMDFASKLQEMGIPVLVTSASWYKLAPFRKSGIPVYYGQILDHLESGLFDTADYSFLIAMSENDSFNMLACERFSPLLGTENVYHLKQSRNFIHDAYDIDKNSYCVLVNNLELRYENLMKYYQYGWVFKETKITDCFSYQDYLNFNSRAISCLLIDSSGKVSFGSNYKENPKPGDIIIAFAPKENNNKFELVG